MKRCVIIGGADIRDYAEQKAYLLPDDYVIYCDSGLRHAEHLGVVPDLIVGDFDSHDRPGFTGEIIALPREKDDTDTVFGAKEGLRRGFASFLFLGCAGNRFDHTMANVSMLFSLDTEGKSALLIDDYSEMEVVSDTAEVSDRYPYFSLLNLTGVARGVTITHAKFPLDKGEITCEYQYGVRPRKTCL